jgi:hypothetical protein
VINARDAVRRWRTGQEAAAKRQRELRVTEQVGSAQAIAESLAALNALDAMALWPGPRDPVSERAIQGVRRRWARVQRRARRARSR